MTNIENLVDSLLAGTGINEEWIVYLRLLILLGLLIITSVLAFYITKKVVIRYLYKFFRKSPLKWDDLLADQKVFNNFSHIVPAIIVRVTAPGIFADFESLLPYVLKFTDIYLIVVGMTIVLAFLKVVQFTLSFHPAFKDKPLTSYFQLIRIILFIVVGILILSLLLNKSPVYFLSAFGAMTAIVLLIFKDTILGLVASVQMSSNDMVRVGDWVEMPKFNADGDVIAINLNTVKVQNWDKTITTIPTYYFITDSFKNWRGMEQSGGRRIKRSLFINTDSIKFVDSEMIEKFKKFYLIRDYIEERQNEISDYNEQNKVDTSVLINGRRMTNIGVFRRYIENYLKNHPRIRQDMTLMVRQMASESRGLPMEIYCFTKTTKWIEYEAIQSDIFDHLYSAAGFFQLDVFQEPSGKDITNAIKNIGTLKT